VNALLCSLSVSPQQTSHAWLAIASCVASCGRFGYPLSDSPPTAREDASVVPDAGAQDGGSQEPADDVVVPTPDEALADTPTSFDADAETDASDDAGEGEGEGEGEADTDAGAVDADGPPSCAVRKRWAFAFDSDPTAYDGNGDGVYDWVARNTVFPTAQLDAGVWRSASPIALDTRPLDDFDGRVLVDLRMASRTVPASNHGAVFWINLNENGPAFSALFVSLALQSDGSQTLTVLGKSSASIETEIGVFAGLPPGFIDLHLDIDPAARTVGIWIAGTPKGELAFPITDVPNADHFATLISWDGVSEFDSVDIRRCGP
jgi:hypothetical protein